MKIVIFGKKIFYPFNDANFFLMQSSPLYTSCLFSMLLNDNIVEIEKLDGKCSPSFVVDEFSGLFLHPSNLPFKHSRSAEVINGALLEFRY